MKASQQANQKETAISHIQPSLEQELLKQKKEVTPTLSPWQIVQLARHPKRPYTLFYIQQIFDSFTELHGDRYFGDDKAIVGGFANLDGETVMVIGHQKGKDTKSRQYRNFGMPNPEGYRKALRLMKLAEKFNKPIVCFIDTPGAYPGIEAEKRGQAEAIAKNLIEMTKLNVPTVGIVIGEGASGGALGIGLADRMMMLQYTWYSVISPESCSSILWRSRKQKEKAAAELKLTAIDMKGFGLIDEIIPEPFEGAHTAPIETAKTIKKYLKKHLLSLQSLSPKARIEQRINKFANMGVFD